VKRNQKGFSVVEGLLIVVGLGIVGFIVWYVLDAQKQYDSSVNNTVQTNIEQNNSGKIYKILGTTDYLCTKSIPARCSGTIKVQDSDGRTQNVKVDKATEFNGNDPATLYKSNDTPINAAIELNSDYVESLILQ
jgi:hypothetical protein